MSNMSYCRFNNTALDLGDCKDAIDEMNGTITGEDGYGEKLSESEFQSAKELIEYCREITEMFEDVDLYDLKLED